MVVVVVVVVVMVMLLMMMMMIQCHPIARPVCSAELEVEIAHR